MILEDAIRRALRRNRREYQKLTGEDPDPLMAEEMEKVIREMPRDAEVIDLLKQFLTRAGFLRDACKAAYGARCV